MLARKSGTSTRLVSQRDEASFNNRCSIPGNMDILQACGHRGKVPAGMRRCNLHAA